MRPYCVNPKKAGRALPVFSRLRACFHRPSGLWRHSTGFIQGCATSPCLKKTESGQKNTTRGFFFVLITLLVLGYILASITLWAKSMEIAEAQYSEKFKMSNLEMVVSQISQERVEKFADISAYHALSAINALSVETPLKKGSDTDQQLHVQNAFRNMMENGTIVNDDFENPSALSSDTVYNDYSFGGWFSKINATISSLGLEVEHYSFSEFKLNQTAMDELNYSFKVEFSISDNSNRAHLERIYYVNGTLKLTGLIDPAIKRETFEKLGYPIEKQFFFLLDDKNAINAKYLVPYDVNPSKLTSGTEGQGWFYGPVVSFADAKSVPVLERNTTILVGNYSEITDLIGTEATSLHWSQFGAYIVTNAPYAVSSCGDFSSQDNAFNALDCQLGSSDAKIKDSTKLDKPFAVVPGFSLDTVPSYAYSDGKGGYANKRVLFVNKYPPEEVSSSPKKKLSSAPVVYSIEKIRDMAVCGYYVHNPKAPSYLQRLFDSPYQLKDEKFGIETFAFGAWINGTEGGYADDLSRLDRELFTAETGEKVRGMPGCKTYEMCNSGSPVGHFSLGDSSIDYLNESKAKIQCKDSLCKGAD